MHLKKKEIRILVDQIDALYGFTLEVDRRSKVERIIRKEGDLIIVDGECLFFIPKKVGSPVPTLKFLLRSQILKSVAIDMPAVKFITNGADVMRPGIVQIDVDIEEGEVVAVVDETHRKPLAVGIAKLSGNEMKKAEKGKVIKNIHYVGDSIWSG